VWGCWREDLLLDGEDFSLVATVLPLHDEEVIHARPALASDVHADSMRGSLECVADSMSKGHEVERWVGKGEGGAIPGERGEKRRGGNENRGSAGEESVGKEREKGCVGGDRDRDGEKEREIEGAPY
jgi:hypothetical protein